MNWKKAFFFIMFTALLVFFSCGCTEELDRIQSYAEQADKTQSAEEILNGILLALDDSDTERENTPDYDSLDEPDPVSVSSIAEVENSDKAERSSTDDTQAAEIYKNFLQQGLYSFPIYADEIDETTVEYDVMDIDMDGLSELIICGRSKQFADFSEIQVYRCDSSGRITAIPFSGGESEGGSCLVYGNTIYYSPSDASIAFQPTGKSGSSYRTFYSLQNGALEFYYCTGMDQNNYQNYTYWEYGTDLDYHEITGEQFRTVWDNLETLEFMAIPAIQSDTTDEPSVNKPFREFLEENESTFQLQTSAGAQNTEDYRKTSAFQTADLDEDGEKELITLHWDAGKQIMLYVWKNAGGEMTQLGDGIECNFIASGTYDIYICSEGHLHADWSGSTPIGFQYENYICSVTNGNTKKVPLTSDMECQQDYSTHSCFVSNTEEDRAVYLEK